jgi:lipid A 3-O-deacylase
VGDGRHVVDIASLGLALVALAGCAGGALTLYEENDALSLRGRQDGRYTQGARVSRVFPTAATPSLAKEIAQQFPLYDEDATTAIGVVLGQTIYTPRDIEVEGLQKRDRPYAGWLYGGVVISNAKLADDGRAGDVQETVELDLGVVGDASQARRFQTQYHEWTDAQRPEGWDHQIGFEVGVVATYENRHRVLYARDLPLGTEFDFMPSYGGAVGNVDTHAGGGATARFGINVPRDMGVNTISTTAMEVTRAGNDAWPSFYLFGGAEGRGVVRNIFLDGNTFEDSHHVDKKPLVGEFRTGFAIQYRALRFTYAWITRSPEFNGQRSWQRYGSASLGLFFDF